MVGSCNWLYLPLNSLRGLVYARKSAQVGYVHLKAMGLKTDLRDIDGPLPAHDLIALMGRDKKVVDGELRFILARDIGQSFVTSDVPKVPFARVTNSS